jgi:hypothetical protein
MGPVIWFFELPGERLQCEIRRSPDAGYEIIWTSNDGRTHVEHSNDPEELLKHRRALEHWLKLDGWAPPGPITPPRSYTRPRAGWRTRAKASTDT